MPRSFPPTPSPHLTIVGFGYSGLMLLAESIRRARGPLYVRVIAEDFSGLGIAYSTSNPLHLLNVRASQMSAWADKHDDFVQWLTSDKGRVAQAAWGILPLLGPSDFAPRCLYGDYLTDLKNSMLEEAVAKGIHIDWHRGRVTAIHAGAKGGWEITTRDAEGADHHSTSPHVALATGHRTKRMFAHIKDTAMIHDPWHLTDAQIESWKGRPVVVLGLGLTALDMLISLRRVGYADPVLALSRSGHVSQPHADHTLPIFPWKDHPIMQANPLKLIDLLRSIRAAIRATIDEGGDWRSVVDGLRTHSPALWQKLSSRDQSRFLARLSGVWGMHRHRMAPPIAAMLQSETEAGLWCARGCRNLRVQHNDAGGLSIAYHSHGASHEETLTPAAIIQCTGVELCWDKMGDPLFDQLLRDRLVMRHPTGLGVQADGQCCLHHGGLYGMGPMLVGAQFESIAIPELRHQAQRIAEVVMEVSVGFHPPT